MEIMKKRARTMNLFYVPALILFAVFVIYPFTKGIFLSFTNWNGYSQSYKMVGINNYIRMLTDQNVHRALLNTIIYGVGSTLLQNVFGLALALLLNQKFRGKSVVRTMVYLPVMIAPLIMGYVMYFFFTYNNGALNDILGVFGLEAIDWLASGTRGTAILTIVNSLQFVGISMVIYLAGLQGIPDMYYEAAAIDGINSVQRFFYITLPLLMPAISSSVTINLIGGLKLFDIISALTGGGPGYDTNSLSTLVHRTYFASENAGYASAIGLISFVLIMVLSNIVLKYLDKKEADLC
ncbi:MAG: sugar ABC transporter permease [Lachnospiraceae bacterium]|nr:sugar ABC transporter permease [Lachnospiraceae bacterium]